MEGRWKTDRRSPEAVGERPGSRPDGPMEEGERERDRRPPVTAFGRVLVGCGPEVKSGQSPGRFPGRVSEESSWSNFGRVPGRVSAGKKVAFNSGELLPP